MTPDHIAILEYIIHNNGNCTNISCSNCILQSSIVLDEYFQCDVARSFHPLGNFYAIKQLAIQKLIDEGYTDKLVGLLL